MFYKNDINNIENIKINFIKIIIIILEKFQKTY